MQNTGDECFVTCVPVHSTLEFVKGNTFAALPILLQKLGWIQVFSNIQCTVQTIDRLGYGK